MHYIDDKGHKSEQQESFNQSYDAKIMLLAIYGLGGGHTNTHINTHTKIST